MPDKFFTSIADSVMHDAEQWRENILLGHPFPSSRRAFHVGLAMLLMAELAKENDEENDIATRWKQLGLDAGNLLFDDDEADN
jgi:hypothetical protein|tara:strand:- start:1631 stop:1879 length:249 start_codon:yes stop_codon:yes gene_type:complete